MARDLLHTQSWTTVRGRFGNKDCIPVEPILHTDVHAIKEPRFRDISCMQDNLQEHSALDPGLGIHIGRTHVQSTWEEGGGGGGSQADLKWSMFTMLFIVI